MKNKKRQQELRKAKRRQQKINQSKKQQQELEQPKELDEDKELEEALEILLKDIHKIAAAGSYIYRGENKNNGKISSNLRRYFQTIVGYAKLQQQKITLDCSFIENPLKKQLGGLAEAIDFAVIEKNIKENIFTQLAQKSDYPLLIGDIQRDLILKDVQEYVDFENPINILTELQHYGGLTNLIDFSHDFAVALFFACDGEPEKDGRLILLRTDDKSIVPPPKNQNSRSIFQKSVFVQRNDGYIDEQEVKKIIIPQKLKEKLLIYVQSYFGIRTETVYRDLAGYIQNQERHSEARKQYFAGIFYGLEKKFKEAIVCYTNAIELKLNFVEAYNSRGDAKTNPCLLNLKTGIYEPDLEGAMYDFNKAINLNPNYAEAYNNRGSMYGRKGRTDLAIIEFNKAISLNPNFAKAYYNRGITKQVLQNHKGATEDFLIALPLAEQKEDEALVIAIRHAMANPFVPSDK